MQSSWLRFGDIWGVEVCECPHMVEGSQQFRFPRTRKRRIRKKWAKDTGNWRRAPMMSVLQLGNRFYCHPVVAAKLRRQIQGSPMTYLEESTPISRSQFEALLLR